jgi:hypothetical protein
MGLESLVYRFAADLGNDTVLDYEDNCFENPNGLQENADGDIAGNVCDCASGDSTVFAAPGESGGLVFGDDGETLGWCSADLTSGTATLYDTLRGAIGEYPVGTGASETCLSMGSATPQFTDATPLVTSREGFWYLTRALNDCGIGNWGFESDGDARVSLVCDP